MKLLTFLTLGFSLLLSSFPVHAFFPYDNSDIVIAGRNASGGGRNQDPFGWSLNSDLKVEISYNGPHAGTIVLDHTQSVPGPNDLDPNTMGWPRLVINLDPCCNAIVWVMARLDREGAFDANGNPIPDGQPDDVWYAATWEYVRATNRPTRPISSLEGGHTKTTEFQNTGPSLRNWRPEFGEYVGLMVSTYARFVNGTIRPNLPSRSNMALIKWGEPTSIDLSTANPCDIAEMIGTAEPEECAPNFNPGILNILLDEDDPVPQ